MATYRVLLLDTWGRAVAELTTASLESFSNPLNDIGSFSFTLPNNSPEIKHCVIGRTEVKVYRAYWTGVRCVWWGVITRASGDLHVTNFQCQTLEWYLSKRVLGPTPISHFTNQYWNYPVGPFTPTGGWAPRRDPYIKRVTTTDQMVTATIVSDTYKVHVTNQPEPMSPGQSLLMISAGTTSNGMFNRDFKWTNPYSKTVTVNLVVWVYLPGSSKRRATHHQKGVQLSLYDPDVPGKQKATSTVKFNSEFPSRKWTRVKLSVSIPADGKEYTIRAALYAPSTAYAASNVAYYANLLLTRPYINEYVNTDQAYIGFDLLRKSQDPLLGKGPMGSGLTWNGGNTGTARTRTYLSNDRTVLYEALQEFTTLDDGYDLNVIWNTTGDAKYLTSSYPRLGDDKPTVILTTDSNISDFALEIDSEWLANRVHIIENIDDDSKRESSYTGSSLSLEPPTTASNPARLLEVAYQATPGSPWHTLYAQARRGYMRYSRLTRSPTITMSSEHTNDLLKRVSLGDRVRVIIKDAWLTADAMYRIVDVQLDPNTDQLSYTVSPEDVD